MHHNIRLNVGVAPLDKNSIDDTFFLVNSRGKSSRVVSSSNLTQLKNSNSIELYFFELEFDSMENSKYSSSIRLDKLPTLN